MTRTSRVSGQQSDIFVQEAYNRNSELPGPDFINIMCRYTNVTGSVQTPCYTSLDFASRHISGRQSICEGGNVIFNTSHPSYFKSLLVDELWICNDVRRFNGIPLPF